MEPPLASVVIIHGFTGKPEEAWRPWLKQELLLRGVAVAIPAMPNANEPTEAEWIQTIDTTVVAAESPIILIGHSLGGLAILRWLETTAKEPIHAAIEVAGVISPSEYPDYNFSQRFSAPADWATIHRMAKHRLGLYSTSDPVIPMAEADLFEQEADAQVLRVSDYGHFSDDSNVTEVPELLQMIDTVIQLAK